MEKALLTLNIDFPKFHSKSKFNVKLYRQPEGEVFFEHDDQINLTLDSGEYRLYIKNGMIKKVINFSLAEGESVNFRIRPISTFISMSICAFTILVWSEYWSNIQLLILSGILLSIVLLPTCYFLDHYVLVSKKFAKS